MTQGASLPPDAHAQLNQVRAQAVCLQAARDSLQVGVGTLGSQNPRKEIHAAPARAEDRFPSPRPAAASGRRTGSGQKGKCEEFPSSLSSVSPGLEAAALLPAVTMDPVDTPIKDGILYQQHVKFGKVGTPGCQAAAKDQQWVENAASAPASDSPGRPGRLGKGVRVKEPTPGMGSGTEHGSRPEMAGAEQALPDPASGRDGEYRSGRGSKAQTSQQGRASQPLTHCGP